MNIKMKVRMSVDIAMTICLLLAMKYELTGVIVHECIGTATWILFVVHNVMNRTWYKSLGKGRYGRKRIANTAINVLLVLCMTIVILSGIMLSQTVFAFIPGSNMLWVYIHNKAAHLGMWLIAGHVLLHWKVIVGMAKKVTI